MANSPQVWKNFYQKLDNVWREKVLLTEKEEEERNRNIQIDFLFGYGEIYGKKYNQDEIKEIDEYVDQTYLDKQDFKGKK